jgi:hypothetical protein
VAPTHDYNIANQSGAAFRADLNNALAAIVSQNSGAAEPSTTYAYMTWADTTNGLFKIRNAANSAWISLYQLDGEWSAIPLENGSATAPPLYFKTSGTDTGIFSPGTDQFGIATAGVERVEYGTSEVVFNDGGLDYDFRVEGDTKANLLLVDASADSVSIDGGFSVTGDATLASINGGPLAGSRNRIINGDMRIDQRNGGASVTVDSSALTYAVDRWAGFGMATAGVFTLNRSTTAPSNFTNSLAAVCTTADGTIAASDRYCIDHRTEGFNVADFGFGSAAARTITLSFWVQSSLTGTYCVALINSAVDRSYVAEYTINTADTWEYKTITVAGNTSGTWLSDNGIGIAVRFTLAAGTTFQTTANAWAAGNFNATANQVNWMSSSSSRTFRITGVQLEPGSVATLFERRSYGQELALCQRYHWRNANAYFPNTVSMMHYFKVEMRTTPTVTWAGAGPTITAINSGSFNATSSSNATDLAIASAEL